MKSPVHISRRSSGAFTLPEMMIAITIFMIVIGGILSAHIFGMRMMQLNTNKLTTTEWSRKTFGRMADEVRSSHAVAIGNYNTNSSSFDGLLDGEAQQGTALLISPTTDTNSYILYVLDVPDQTFIRMTDQANSSVTLANSITNTIAFTAQDFSGNLLTSLATSNNPVIHFVLQFSLPESFLQEANQYKLETSMTRR
jgi:hypothetical protein